MTTGEWSCLISFTWAPLTCSEREGSEKFRMKIYVSSGTARPRWLDIKWSIYSLTVFCNGYVTIPVWNRLWFDTLCKVL